MKTTNHFWDARFESPDRGRIQFAWIQRVVDRPTHEVVQSDGRILRWGAVPELGGRYIRVVLLADGETVHTAFIDGRFRP